jgi:hypothetical protein
MGVHTTQNIEIVTWLLFHAGPSSLPKFFWGNRLTYHETIKLNTLALLESSNWYTYNNPIFFRSCICSSKWKKQVIWLTGTQKWLCTFSSCLRTLSMRQALNIYSQSSIQEGTLYSQYTLDGINDSS